MKGIREIALTPYYPYGKNKEKIIAKRIFDTDEAIDKHDTEIRADERKKTLEFVSKHGNTIVVGGRNADARRRYWVEVMLKEMQKEQKGETE